MPTFLHAPLLWGLLLASVPVLIHLINMMRHRRVRWAAMEFLLVSRKKNRTWVLLKELLLLAARMSIVAIIVLMVAQPLLRDQLGAVLGGSKTHHIVLLDDSFSMSDRSNGATVMDRAKEAVDRIGAMAAAGGDSRTFTLLRFSEAGRGGRRTQPDMLQEQVDSEFRSRLRETLKTIRGSEMAAGPVAPLEAIGQLLGEGEDETRVVYLVSDFRKKEWDRPEDIRSRLAELRAKGVSLHLINCVDARRPNLALTRLELTSGTVAAGIALFMEVEVRNFGDEPARNVSVVLEEDGHARPAVRIDEIPAGESARERFEVTFAAGGSHRVAARLDGDAVTADNYRYAVVDVPLEVPALIVDGSVDQQGAFFLSAALSPGGNVRTGIRPRVETPRFLDDNPLDLFPVIYLTDVAHLDQRAVKALEGYVAGGGGLAIFLGPRCRAGFLNEGLWRGGEGLLPAPIEGENELFIDRLDNAPDLDVVDHPVFRVLGGQNNSFLSQIKVGRYFTTPKNWKPDAESTVRIIARLRDGAPLVVEKTLGKGRVVTWHSTAAPIWNNAGSSPAFVVLVQEMQAYLARRVEAADPLLVGSPIELSFDPAQYQNQVRFVSPGRDGAETTAHDAVLKEDNMLHARLARTDAAGVHEAQLLTATGMVDARRFAVNVDPAEGDLARLDGPQLGSRLDGVEYAYHQADTFEARRDASIGRNLSDVLLYLLIVLLVGEMLLAWSCSYHPPQARVAAPFGRGAVA
ncbi:MAG: hypothetical protein GX621_00195 [Pirellulaceae bacterium]|nr:hypothetical protein [Pirellulaceae bacterium]